MSEPIIDVENEEPIETKKSDFVTIIKDFLLKIPWKLSIGLFLLLIILMSKSFSEMVLYKLGGDRLVDGDCPTNTGTIVICILASLGFITMNALIETKLL